VDGGKQGERVSESRAEGLHPWACLALAAAACAAGVEEEEEEEEEGEREWASTLARPSQRARGREEW